MMRHRFLPWIWLLSLLQACSGYAPPDPLSGISREALLARMGQPDLQRPTDTGTRLEFPRGPFGKHTWFVYLDAQGRAIRSEQVLTEDNFNRVHPGMAQDELRRLLGRPGEVQGLARSRGEVWSYRYENPFCNWFQVELSLQGEVRSAGRGPAPECDSRNEMIFLKPN